MDVGSRETHLIRYISNLKMKWLISALVVSCFMMVPVSAEPDLKVQRLKDEIAKLDTTPCSTQIYFKKLAEWVITCPDCSYVSANRFYPKKVIRLIDDNAIDGVLSMNKLLSLLGGC